MIIKCFHNLHHSFFNTNIMAYTDFTLSDLEEKFGVKNERRQIHFDSKPMPPSERLRAELEESTEMPIKSEKARSEWIVVPILKELRTRNDKFFTVYSGDTLVGERETGLQGERLAAAM